jgi:iron complex outermembrane receptor protein
LLIGQNKTASIAGAVYDEQKAVILGATVRIIHVETGATREVITDGQGWYKADALEPGEYEISAEQTGFQTSVLRGINLNSGQEAVVDFTLTTEIKGDEFNLRATTGQMEGRVLDPQGLVVRGATVTAINVLSGAQLSTKSDAMGIYRFNLLPAGEYRVTASHPQFADAQVNAAVIGSQTIEVDLRFTQLKHLTTEEIVVTEAIVSTGATITEPILTVVGVRSIEKGKNSSIPDVLKYEPEIDISRRASVGDTRDTLSIRGLSGNRIMLSIDGRSVNAAGVQGGYFIDWSTIPLDNIEKIEVVKGGSCVKYGNTAGGGVINVITKRPTRKPTFSFYGNYGAGAGIGYDQNYRIAHTHKIGGFGYSLAGSYHRADAFLWNNDYEAKNVASNLYIDMPSSGAMYLGVQYTLIDRGFSISNRLSDNPDNPNFDVRRNPDYPVSFGESFSPGAGNVTTPGPGAHWEKPKYFLDFGYKQPLKNALLEFKAYKNYENRHESNYSASWVNNSYPEGELVLDRTVKSDRSWGGSIELWMPVKNHEILAGIERKVIATGGQEIHYVDVNYGVRGTVSSSGGQSAYMWGYYLQDSWRPIDRLLLTPGIRYDTYDAMQSSLGSDVILKADGISLSLAGTYSLTNDTFTASIYRKYLTPSAPNSYWWYQGYVDGLYDTILKPEKNDAIELAYKHDVSSKAFTKFSFYHYKIDDYMKRYRVPEGRGCYNIDNVKLTGASIDGVAEIIDWFTFRANVTYQKSKKEGDIMDRQKRSDELEYKPRWKFNLGFNLLLPHKAILAANIRHVGRQETIYSGMIRELDSYVITDLELKVPVAKHYEIGAYAENLFDKDYAERFGYPLPGRIIGATAKIVF